MWLSAWRCWRTDHLDPYKGSSSESGVDSAESSSDDGSVDNPESDMEPLEKALALAKATHPFLVKRTALASDFDSLPPPEHGILQHKDSGMVHLGAQGGALSCTRALSVKHVLIDEWPKFTFQFCKDCRKQQPQLC